ncbi:MAG: PIN domain-containing protein [Desulfovibrionales bacterium]|nr:MAG: PIN domain-containing protein [Desulfovibrionales bacterium]
MIGLDTYVLVRYLTQDDPEQSVRANRFIDAHCTKDMPGLVTAIVLCELIWVLRGAYGYEKSLVVKVLEQILTTSELQVENEQVVRSALSAFRRGSADFADYILIRLHRRAGCEATFSFDEKLARHDFVRIP